LCAVLGQPMVPFHIPVILSTFVSLSINSAKDLNRSVRFFRSPASGGLPQNDMGFCRTAALLPPIVQGWPFLERCNRFLCESFIYCLMWDIKLVAVDSSTLFHRSVSTAPFFSSAITSSSLTENQAALIAYISHPNARTAAMMKMAFHTSACKP